MDSRGWPLVAREEELAVVVSMLDDEARAGVVLGGAAGVGKSRLAAEAAQAARERGWPVVTLAASKSLAGIPFGAFAGLIPDTRGQSAGSQFQVLQTIASTLSETADGARVLLSVDDGHLLDEASSAALLHVVRSRAATVLLTVRSGEATTDAVQALWKDELLGRLDLQPLGRHDVERLVSAVLGGPVDPASVQRLFNATGGNALLLREVLYAADAAGTLTNSSGVWRWDVGHVASPRLTELVEARIGHRSPEERRALELIALGEPLEFALLVDMVDRDAVAHLERDGLVVLHRDDKRMYARLVHPVYASVISETLAPMRAIDHRLALASALDATGARRKTDMLRSATWRLEAGEVPPAEVAVEAAVMANRLFDAELARRFGEVALEAGAGLDAALALAAADVERNRFSEAERVLGDHEAAVTTFADALLYLPLRMRVLGTLERDADALAVLDRFAARESARDWNQLLAAMRAGVYERMHEWDLVLKHGQPLLEADDVDERVMLLAVNPVTMTLCLQGKTDTCLALGEKAIEPALRLLHEFPDALGWAAAARVSAMLYAGYFDELDEFLLAVYDDSLARGDDALTGQITFALGSACLSRGYARRAVDWLTKAAAVLRLSDPDGYLRMCLALLAESYNVAGDLEASERALAEADALPVLHATQTSTTQIVRAWLAAMRGDTTAAPAMLVDAVRTGDFPPIEQAQLLHHAVRIGCEDRKAWQQLAALGDGAEAGCMIVWSQHGAALLDGSGAALMAVAERFASMTMWLVAAEAAAQAARAYRAEGKDDTARRARSQSALWFANAEAVRTPLLVELQSPVPLSKREREVGLLASRGASNAEIAEQLVLSVRTVESHLYRLMGKLGVERREDLRGLIR